MVNEFLELEYYFRFSLNNVSLCKIRYLLSMVSQSYHKTISLTDNYCDTLGTALF